MASLRQLDVDPLPATIATIVIIAIVMILPIIVYMRIVCKFACDRSLQRHLGRSAGEEDASDDVGKKGEEEASTPPPPPPPVLLSFSSTTYTVRKTSHAIVKGVSGWFAPGTLTAILGTSGCGKTTLLSVLADQMDPTGVSTGVVMVNARPTKQINFRQLCAYVMQSDNLMESLTVKEFLWFAAELRLSSALEQQDKLRVVDELLADLDLTAAAHRYIHLLSGGQKRRVTVACELVSRPSLVFLDEPTSGLDASGSLKLVKVLRKLADQGRTVVATIHQPRIDAFNRFHMMLLMDKGRLLYFGPVTGVVEFMRPKKEKEEDEENAEEEEAVENPADFVLDLTHGADDDVRALVDAYDSSELSSAVQLVVDKIHSGFLRPGEFYGISDEQWFPELHQFPGTVPSAAGAVGSPLATGGGGNPDGDDAKEEEDGDDDDACGCCGGDDGGCCGWHYVFSYASSFLKQHFTLIRRSLLNEWRNTSYVMTWVMGIIMMLFMGMLYCYVEPPPLNSQAILAVEDNLVQWGACVEGPDELDAILNTTTGVNATLRQCGHDLNRSMQLDLARTSLLYQLLASMFFSEMPMIAVMFADRQLFAREHAAKSYSTFAWVLSWVSKMSFTGLVKGLVFPPFVYFSAQLTLSAEAYFLFCIFMGAMSIAGCTFALLAVVCFSSPESATVAFVCLNVVAQNLSGYFIDYAFMPWWFRFAIYFNFFSYSYHGITQAQKLSPEAWRTAQQQGQQAEFNNIELDAWVSALVAVLLCVAFQLLAFAVLAVSGGNQFQRRSGRKGRRGMRSTATPPPVAATAATLTTT